MKNIILILIFSFTNIYAQSNKFCNLYLPQCKNESLLEEFYSCEGKFYAKFKYGDTRDVILEKQSDGSFKILNIEQMLNQKYLNIKKFQKTKYFIILKKNKMTLRVTKNNQDKFYDYLKSKKQIPKYLLES